MKPIFFAWTRSFWLTATGVLLIVFGAPPEVLNGIGAVIALVTPWDAYQVAETLSLLAPAVLWLAALQQRSGASRPYTIDHKAL